MSSLTFFAEGFEVYTVSDNTLNRASKDELQEAFNTSNVTEAIEHILQHGNIQPLGKEGRRGSVDRSGPELLQAGASILRSLLTRAPVLIPCSYRWRPRSGSQMIGSQTIGT